MLCLSGYRKTCKSHGIRLVPGRGPCSGFLEKVFLVFTLPILNLRFHSLVNIPLKLIETMALTPSSDSVCLTVQKGLGQPWCTSESLQQSNFCFSFKICVECKGIFGNQPHATSWCTHFLHEPPSLLWYWGVLCYSWILFTLTACSKVCSIIHYCIHSSDLKNWPKIPPLCHRLWRLTCQSPYLVMTLCKVIF